jgi:hypothetical protein
MKKNQMPVLELPEYETARPIQLGEPKIMEYVDNGQTVAIVTKSVDGISIYLPEGKYDFHNGPLRTNASFIKEGFDEGMKKFYALRVEIYNLTLRLRTSTDYVVTREVLDKIID